MYIKYNSKKHAIIVEGEEVEPETAKQMLSCWIRLAYTYSGQALQMNTALDDYIKVDNDNKLKLNENSLSTRRGNPLP